MCCDGLEKIEGIEQVIIAGIGGEEIIKILKNSYIPQKFVFQPMKNANLLRTYLLQNGCAIERDDIFSDGKNYYFIIKGRLSGDTCAYTKAQSEFGRDSLNNSVLRDYLNIELDKKKSYLTRKMNDKSRADVLGAIAFLEGVLSGEIK